MNFRRTFILLMLCLPCAVNGLVVGQAALDLTPLSATVSFGMEQAMLFDVFSIADKSWKKIYPQPTDSYQGKAEGVKSVFRSPKNAPVSAVITYTLASNGIRAVLEAAVPPNSGAHYAVWELFLTRGLFTDAVVKRQEQPDATLTADGWKTIDVESFTLSAKSGEWTFTLTSDDGVPWKLRSLCDRTWGPDERKTFSLLHQIENVPAEGMKSQCTVDIRFSPRADFFSTVEERSSAKAIAYMRSLLSRYDSEPAREFSTARENAAWLSKRLAEVSADRTENRIDPNAGTIIPEPKTYIKDKGFFAVPQKVAIACGIHEAAFEVLAEDLSRFGVSMTRSEAAPITMGVNGDASVEAASKRLGIAEKRETEKEGYTLVVTPKEILIAGADGAGVLYGTQTLRQLIRAGANGAEIPAVRIKDRPDLPFRGFYIEGGGRNSGPEMKRLIRNVYSYFKANTIVYQVKWGELAWKSHPEVAGKDALPVSSLAEMAAYAKKYHLRFIPAVFTYGKVMDLLKSHPEIAEDPDWQKKGWPHGAYCPNRPKTYPLVFDLLNEVIDATQCDAMHIAHDEIAGMVVCPVCKTKDPADLFANDVNKTRDFLEKRNVRTMIWGDFLLEKDYWEKLGVENCNSGNPHYGGLIVHPALQKLNKDIIITDWHYNYRPSIDTTYLSFNYFSTNGFQVIGCPWLKNENNYFIPQVIKSIGQQGVLVTDWGFLATRSPAANSMLGVMYAWNTSMPEPKALSWSPQAVLAGAIIDKDKPSRMHGARFTPINLAASANRTLTGGNAWFGGGSHMDLSLLPMGSQRMIGVDYAITNACVVSGNTELDVPATGKRISINRKARSIVLLHGLTLLVPSVTPMTYGSYRVTYANGSSTEIPINSRNAVHWLSGAPRKNSWQHWAYQYTWDASLAWECATRSSDAINLQSYEWVNQNPDDAIDSIELIAKQNIPGLMIGLVAVTAVQ
ncbi:MAG: beta-N-acetylhexosaminidase [Spirochaetota bacterium]